MLLHAKGFMATYRSTFMPYCIPSIYMTLHYFHFSWQKLNRPTQFYWSICLSLTNSGFSKFNTGNSTTVTDSSEESKTKLLHSSSCSRHLVFSVYSDIYPKLTYICWIISVTWPAFIPAMLYGRKAVLVSLKRGGKPY